jgi:hypothetical protein
MDKKTSQNDSTLAGIDNALYEPTLLTIPRALLLLRVCQFAQAFRPGILDYYWIPLLEVCNSLDGDYHEAFKVLNASVEPSKAEIYKGFTRKIIDTVNTAFDTKGFPKDDANAILLGCEERLCKRWWPFDKKAAWIALVQALAKVDRRKAQRLLKKVPHEVKKSTISQMNRISPLTIEEWDLVYTYSRGITTVIKEMLDEEKLVLHLSPKLAENIGKQLLKEVHKIEYSPKLKDITESRRIKAYQRYTILVNALVDEAPDTAEKLMESFFTAFVETQCFKKEWPERLTALRKIINYWVAFSPLKEKVKDFFVNHNIGFLHDFALSYWQGIIVTSQEEAEEAIDLLNQECGDLVSSEIWFLVTLINNGRGQVALNLAQSSPRSRDLLPRIRRAWLCIEPGKASSLFSTSDLQDDIIGQFLLLKSDQERVDFLRQKTENGQKSLPTQMWEKDRSLMTLYNKDEPDHNHFKEYVRMHGYSNYDYRELDPYLLITLISWYDKYPGEVESLFSRMWDVIRPDDVLLTWDAKRNSIFERCYTLFSISPQSLDKLFVKWVKGKMVDKSIIQYSGNMTSSFSLKPFVLFLYCLLGAEKVTNISPVRRDDIIKHAIRTYKTEGYLMESAAKLFASDKELSALKPPVDLLQPHYLQNWQIGVIEASTKEILAMVIGEGQKENSPLEN